MSKESYCLECAAPFTSTRPATQFCGPACRGKFNRRRRDRGAQLYDFVMVNDAATVAKLTDAYRIADLALREGRRSWQSTQEARFALPAVFGPTGDKR